MPPYTVHWQVEKSAVSTLNNESYFRKLTFVPEKGKKYFVFRGNIT
jgi:hypothetical protein